MEKIKNGLIKCCLKTPLFTLKDKIYLAKCVKCYDADTIHIVIEFNNEFRRFKCRLNNIDCAEIRSKDNLEKEIALDGKKWLSDCILNKLIWVKCGDFDMYGRLLVVVKPYNNELIDNIDFDTNINEELIILHFGYQYGGGKKRLFSEWHQPLN